MRHATRRDVVLRFVRGLAPEQLEVAQLGAAAKHTTGVYLWPDGERPFGALPTRDGVAFFDGELLTTTPRRRPLLTLDGELRRFFDVLELLARPPGPPDYTLPVEPVLLAAVLNADVDDDAPRFHYAAWIEPRDRARAEAIRLGIEVRRGAGGDVAAAAAALLDEHRFRWADYAGVFVLGWDRGFVDEIQVTDAGRFAHFGKQVLDEHPVRALRLKNRKIFEVGTVLAVDECVRLRQVELTSNDAHDLLDEHVAALLASPWARRKGGGRLLLDGVGASEAALRALHDQLRDRLVVTGWQPE